MSIVEPTVRGFPAKSVVGRVNSVIFVVPAFMSCDDEVRLKSRFASSEKPKVILVTDLTHPSIFAVQNKRFD